MSTYSGGFDLDFAVEAAAPSFGTYLNGVDLDFAVDAPAAVFFGGLDLDFTVEAAVTSTVLVKSLGQLVRRPSWVKRGDQLVDPVTGDPVTYSPG